VQLHFNNLHKRFGRREVLRGIDIQLRGGECNLLIGVNGAGKSTLLRIIAGLEKPDRGKVDMGIGPVTWRRCRNMLHNHILYLHQQPYLFSGSVRYNLAYALPRGLTRSVRARRIDEALNWAGLEGIADMPAHTLSGGERQRVALGRAWLREPGIMLLDEPTSNMDQEARVRTLGLLGRLKRSNISLLVASHDPSHFLTLADHHLQLEKGRLTAVESCNTNVTLLRRDLA
jgi:tungstate transport system ATP-binding protein